MRNFFCCALLCLLFPLLKPVMAADIDGSFAVRNAGMVECRTYLEEKKKGPRLNLYLGWIDGYISAANQFTANTYDYVPWGNTVYLATLLESYCKKHPGERFYVAVNKLLASFSKRRLRARSEMVAAEYGGKKTYVYGAVLKKMQSRLKEAGYFKGTPDGRYSPETRDALLAFQKAERARETGLPDQLTLYLIDKKLGNLVPVE